jgi:hypothetical protein
MMSRTFTTLKLQAWLLSKSKPTNGHAIIQIVSDKTDPTEQKESLHYPAALIDLSQS